MPTPTAHASRLLALAATGALLLSGAAAAQAVTAPSAGSTASVLTGGAAKAPAATAQTDLVLRYDEPATDWQTETLPIGNGAMGASIYGGVSQGRIQLNEKTLWSGGPGVEGYNFGNYDKADRPNALTKVRERINTEHQVDPGWVADMLGQPKTGYGSYQPFGELHLQVPGVSDYSGYERSLNLDTATAAVTYESDGVTYTREFIASYPDGVIVTHLSATEPSSIDFTASYVSQIDGGQVSAENGRITLKGSIPGNGLDYNGQVQIVTDGGTVTESGNDVLVQDADSATLIWAGGTNYAPTYPDYREDDPNAFTAQVTSAVDDAADKGWQELLKSHEADYTELFDRVQLDLDGAPLEATTDVALDQYDGQGPQDRRLEQMFFQYGRYLLISSSRPGSLPANLQGVWNNSTAAPWGADYHTNINLQMNYWPALSTNLAETYEPYVNYVESLVPAGEVSAEKILGMDGWMVNNETTPWGFTGVHDWATAFWFPEATAWLAVDVYRQYQYSQDRQFLAEHAYPLLKKTSKFWMDYLVADPRDGQLVANPSYSPEHGDFTAGAAMSQQLATEVLADTVEAAKILDVDPDLRSKVAQVLEEVDPGLRVGSWGQLQEWKADLDVKGDTHRHVSQLYGLFPGNAISPRHTPKFADAARVTLNSRGDGGTGWSKAWKINFWANLGDGDRAHKLLSEQLMNSTYQNLWDAHPPFQIDGNFGATSGIAEMFVRSNAGGVHLLPALPSAWQNGSVSGLRAQGGLTVGATWSDGAPTELRITPDETGEISVHSEVFTSPVRITAGSTAVDATIEDGLATWSGEAGVTYTVTPLATMTLTAPTEVSQGSHVDVVATVAGEEADGDLKLQVPEGWQVSPVCTAVTGPGEYGFTVAVPGDAQLGDAELTATLGGEDWVLEETRTLSVEPQMLDQGQMSVTASSHQAEVEPSPVSNVLDGDPATIWHSQWSTPEANGMPWLSVDLGQEYTDLSLYLLPRQAGNTNGVLKEYNVYVSDDGKTWGDPVATGSFPNSRDQQTIELPDDVSASQVKIEWVSSYSDTDNFGSLAELNVGAGSAAGSQPEWSVDPGTCADDGGASAGADGTDSADGASGGDGADAGSGTDGADDGDANSGDTGTEGADHSGGTQSSADTDGTADSGSDPEAGNGTDGPEASEPGGGAQSDADPPRPTDPAANDAAAGGDAAGGGADDDGAPVSGTPSGSDLPETGADPWAVLGLAGLVLLLGVATVRAARRVGRTGRAV